MSGWPAVRWKHCLGLLACVCVLSACSTAGRNYITTVSELTASRGDVVLTDAQISALRYPSVYLRFGDGPQVLAVLALLEDGESKWITSDRNLVVVRGGRLRKVAGPGFGPLFTSDEEHDPLRDPRSITQATRWVRQMDWQAGDEVLSNYTVESTYEVQQGLRKPIANLERTLTRILEHNRIVQTGEQFTNEFWVDPGDGAVISSRQYALPARAPIELTALPRPASTSGNRAAAHAH